MRILLGFVVGWMGTVAAALIYGEIAGVSQREGAYAMGAVFIVGPAGGVVGALLGGALGARWAVRPRAHDDAETPNA
jgi:MFS family permease